MLLSLPSVVCQVQGLGWVPACWLSAPTLPTAPGWSWGEGVGTGSWPRVVTSLPCHMGQLMPTAPLVS